MKKTFLIFVSIVLSLAVILPGATAVMADSEKEGKSQPSVRAALMIRAPSRAEVGQPVTIAVFGKYNHQPVAGAEVYALKTDKIANAADKKNYTTTAADYIASPAAPSFFRNIIGVFNRLMGKGKADKAKPSIGTSITESESVVIAEEVQNIEQFQKSGISLGTTNDKGEVVYSFNDTGHYMLAAFKGGYIPDFARINVVLSDQKALGIKAPDKAEVGKPVTITVFQRGTSQVVAQAGVYALAGSNNVTAVLSQKPTTLILTPKPADVVSGVSLTAAEVKSRGIFLGYTDDKGQVTPTFDKTGRYVLAAIKDGYIPGFTRISIVLAAQKALGIKAPDKAEVGNPVTIKVFERGTSQNVTRAGVYALRVGDIDRSVPLEPMLQSGGANLAEAEKYAADVKSRGTFLGYTDESGQLIYTFSKVGHYLLVAIKDGYIPGFARIAITSSGGPKALVIKVPAEAIIGEQVSIAVRERHSGEAVAQASIYALRVEDADTANGFLFRADPPNTDITARDKFTAAVKSRGGYIGSTDSNGILVHRFPSGGHYLLVAIKDGYAPDFARIYIKLRMAVPQKPQVITSPKPFNTD